ncbi:MAG: c-type cytochrome [Pseudomonadota bacterium]
MKRILAATLASLLTLPAHADGDAEAGKKVFNKCKACHMIADPAGEVIVKGGRTGPNLYGIAGRTAGTYEDFRYGDSIVTAGENGLVWDEDSFVAFSQDPKAFLKDYLDQTSAKSKMTFRLKSGGEDVYAYLVSVSGG